MMIGLVAGAGQARTAPAQLAAMTSKPAVVKGNTWYLRTSLTSGFGEIVFKYGRAGTFPLMGDWDGDGAETPGIVDGNKWYLRNSNTTGFADIAFVYGVNGDLPIVGDWDGDGIDTPGVVRTYPGHCGGDVCTQDANTWHLRNTNTSGVADITFSYRFGYALSGDWDGDGDDTPGDRGGNHWFLNNDFDSLYDVTFIYGSGPHLPIRGDWDGDGIDSAGVVSGNTWLVRNALTSGFADFSFKFGSAGDRFLVWE
jgi:lactocepin